MNEPTQFKCEKCQSYFKKKEGLEKHLIRKFPCVKDTTVPQISTNSINPTPVPQISTNNTEFVEMKEILMVLVNEIRTLKEEVACLKSICSTNTTPVPQISMPVSIEVPQISMPVSIEVPQISTPVSIEVPIVKKKKVKKQSEAIEPPKPRLRYVYPTEEKEQEQEKEQEKEQDLPIHPELKTYLDNLNDRFKNSTPPIELSTDQIYYNNDNIFGYNQDIDKTVIYEDELANFIEKSATVDSQLEWYFHLFKNTFNFTTGFHYDIESQRLYSLKIDKKWEWNESSLINKLRCNIYDTINSAVANSGVVYKTYTDRLFAVKRLAYHKDINAELNEKLLQLLKTHFQERRIN